MWEVLGAMAIVIGVFMVVLGAVGAVCRSVSDMSEDREVYEGEQ